jgi:hypothetical protein
MRRYLQVYDVLYNGVYAALSWLLHLWLILDMQERIHA